MIKPWKKIGSRPAGDFRIFTIRSDRKISPRTQQEHDFYIIDAVNWVNVIALTPDRQIVMVEQYRHGSDTIELEIPGGMMDASDGSPEITGQRNCGRRPVTQERARDYWGRSSQIRRL